MKNLKSNYKLNKTLLKGNQISEFDKILIKLQGKIIEKFPNSIELTFAEESDDNYCLNLEDFGQILSKEIKLKLHLKVVILRLHQLMIGMRLLTITKRLLSFCLLKLIIIKMISIGILKMKIKYH